MRVLDGVLARRDRDLDDGLKQRHVDKDQFVLQTITKM
jgi:hypothetical protein